MPLVWRGGVAGSALGMRVPSDTEISFKQVNAYSEPRSKKHLESLHRAYQ
jgi:hypothetical protein